MRKRWRKVIALLLIVLFAGAAIHAENVDGPQAVLLRSKQYLSDGKTTEAIKVLELYLAKNDRSEESITAARLLGEIYTETGNTKLAQAAFRHARWLGEYLGTSDDNMKNIRRGLAEAKDKVLGEPEATFRKAEGRRSAGNVERALPLYEKVCNEYPGHELAHPSGYYIGLCLSRMGKVNEAWRHWQNFVEKSPAGPWRCQTLIGIGDLTLEHRFSYQDALSWYKAAQKNLKSEGLDSSWRDAEPDVHIRLGVCAYIANKYKDADAHFAEADRLRPDTRWGEGIPGGMGLLVEACRKRQPLLPSSVMQGGGDRTRLVMLLAAIYAKSWQYERAEVLYSRVAGGEFPATGLQRAYARMEQGEQLRQLERTEEALACYEDFKPGGPYGNTLWAGEGILRGAVILYQKSKSRSEAVEMFNLVMKRYPQDKEAARAQLYIGMHWHWEKQWERAIAEWRKLIAMYPRSIWAEQAKRELIPLALKELGKKEK